MKQAIPPYQLLVAANMVKLEENKCGKNDKKALSRPRNIFLGGSVSRRLHRKQEASLTLVSVQFSIQYTLSQIHEGYSPLMFALVALQTNISRHKPPSLGNTLSICEQ